MTAVQAPRRYTPRDPAPLAQAVILWLWVDLALAVVGAATSAFLAAAYARVPPGTALGFSQSLPGASVQEMVSGLAGLAQLVVSLVCGFLILKWTYRVIRNAHAMAQNLTITPPWAVGWYFVPLANLLMPFRALREAWQVSARPDAWQTVPVPDQLRLWWGLWLASNILGNVALRLSFTAKTVGASLVSTIVEIAQDVTAIPLDLVFIAVVRSLTRLQVEALRRTVFD